MIGGLGLVLVGLITSIIALSVVGFVVVVGACGFTVQSIRSRSTAAPDGPAGVKAVKHSGLRSRMEDRLRRRFDES